MSDWILVGGFAGIVAIAAVDKFCEAYGFKNAVYALKVGVPIAGMLGLLIGVWSFT